jgi:hypothetical protein
MGELQQKDNDDFVNKEDTEDKGLVNNIPNAVMRGSANL